MKYLLDTHIVLWLAENSPKLTERSKAIVLDEACDKYVSIVSCWEVSIKISLGRLYLDGGTSEFFRIIQENGFTLLDITEGDLNILEVLPLYHRDPFDRLLVATAMSNGLSLLSDDSLLTAYAGEGFVIIA